MRTAVARFVERGLRKRLLADAHKVARAKAIGGVMLIPVPKRLGRVLLAGIGLALLCQSPATAADSYGSAYTYAGGGDSYQYFFWDKAERKLRIKVHAGDISTYRCVDGMLDWQTSDGSHYDARVVRVCQPGATEETDPAGDHKWEEPAGWDGRTSTGLRIAVGYVMTDRYPFEILTQEIVPSSEETGFYGVNRVPPRTGDPDYWARIRTKYQSGETVSWDPQPQHCYGPATNPFNCN